MNLGTHVIQFPTGRWGYVGSLPLQLGTLVPATKSDILGCRTVGKDADGKPLAAKYPSFETKAEAIQHAGNCGVAVTQNADGGAPRQPEQAFV